MVDLSNQAQPSFLITRLSAIGDCMETLPMAMAIKRRWPSSKLTWIVDCGVDSLLKCHPAVDRVIRVRKGFLKRPAECWRLRRELLSSAFDVSIDPQGLFKSGFLGWLAGARLRIGFDRGQAREFAWRFYHHAIDPHASHLVDRQLELLGPLGIESSPAEFGWRETSTVGEEVERMMSDLELQTGQFALINPGASWESKRWPSQRFSAVATELFQARGLPSLVVWGNQEERRLAQSIVSDAREACRLAPDTSLLTLAGLLMRSRCYLGSDTGPMHMAVAVGTPCVALFGATRAEYCGPYGAGHRVLQVRYDAGTSRYRRNASNAAMREITVEMVVEKCLDLLSKPSEYRRAS